MSMWDMVRNTVSSAAESFTNELFAWQKLMAKGVDPMLGANEHSLEGISPLQAYLCAKASRHIYSDTKHIATELYRKPPIDEARKVRYTWREYNGVELSMDAVEPMQKEPHQSIYEQDRADRDFSPSMKSIADEHMYIIHNRHPRCIFYMSNGSNHTLVDDKAYLVFRGTHEGNDVGVILDHELAQFKTDKATLMAHRGIAGKLDQIWGRIEAELKQLPKSIKQLYITGHSLGGAYALLCGARILMSKQHLLPPGVSVKVVTFGAPLVFARNALEDKALPTALTAAMKGRTFNFVFGCDVVPRLLGTGLSTTFIKMLQVAGIGCPGNAEANTGTSTADGVSESSSFSFQASYFNPSLKQFTAVGSLYYLDAANLDNPKTIQVKRFRSAADVTDVAAKVDTTSLLVSPVRALADHAMLTYLVSLAGLCRRRTEALHEDSW